MNISFDYSNKRVLVTGGVSGIGRAISLAYLAAGAQVIACGITEQELAAARSDPALRREHRGGARRHRQGSGRQSRRAASIGSTWS